MTKKEALKEIFKIMLRGMFYGIIIIIFLLTAYNTVMLEHLDKKTSLIGVVVYKLYQQNQGKTMERFNVIIEHDKSKEI